MTRWTFGVVAFFLASFFLFGVPRVAFAQTAAANGYDYTSPGDALAACQSYLSASPPPGDRSCVLNNGCTVSDPQCMYILGGHGAYAGYWFGWKGYNFCANAPDINGSIVAPAGSGLPEAENNGCCYIPSTATGGSNASGQQLVIGVWSATGAQCDGTHPGLVTGATTPNTSTTSNPNGSTTFCTTGTTNPACITTSPAPDAPPASSSSSANDTTNYSSTTSNPATSSSTTTSSTTTTTGTTTSTGSSSGSVPSSGSSTGGTAGTYTGTSTTTGTSNTSSPASSSSTSGKCTSAVCDVGQADGQVGSLYTTSGDSISAEFASYSAQVASTPIASAVPKFFSFTPSGTCPTWTIPGNKYWGEAGFSFAFLCQPAFLDLLQAAGMIVLAVAAFSAFRIALY